VLESDVGDADGTRRVDSVATGSRSVNICGINVERDQADAFL